MSYNLEWTSNAVNSYFEEIEFIYLKWNEKEVLKFEKLVEKELKRLSSTPSIGKLIYKNIYSFSISKQTSIFFRIKKEVKLIELLLFWNNQKNPNDLIKLL